MTITSSTLIGSILVILLASVVVARTWRAWQAARIQLVRTPPWRELRKFRRWGCPSCGQEFGRESRFWKCERPESYLPFKPCVSIVCDRCQTYNVFDEHGNFGIENGLPSRIPNETWEEELERVDRLARETRCVRCGAAYEEWNGIESGTGGERIEGATGRGPVVRVENYVTGPVLSCPSCGKGSRFVERDGRLHPLPKSS